MALCCVWDSREQEGKVQVVRRRAQRSLQLKQSRLHIVVGFLTAVDDLDAVVKTIRNAKDGRVAKAALQEGWGLDEDQADAVLNLSLRRLTGLAIDELKREAQHLEKDIASLEKLLGSEVRVSAACRRQCTGARRALAKCHAAYRHAPLPASLSLFA